MSKSSWIGGIDNWVNQGSAPICVDSSPYLIWNDWNASQRDLFITNQNGEIVFKENITSGISNDINAILETYGVEAARASIVSEVLSVFGVYGIEVDPRHLALIADYMTFEGTYRAMNRLGIGGSASPFLKMSFETSMNFLTAATTRGSLDNGESPSARIVLGRVVANGTGSCGVRMNWDMMQIDDDDDDA